tara:strand:- start:821 stop:1804 length:984 start_codon:yes stop_codon:yes gene_type:complete
MESAIDKVSKRIEVGEEPVLVATSGTAMAIGNLISNKETHIQSKLQGYKISKNKLNSIVSQLIKMTPDERSHLSSLSERRSEIIVPGALILQTIMNMVGVNEIVLSERALREGLVVDWMCRNNYLKDQLSFQGSIRERTVLHQSRRFGVNSKRSKLVSEFALTFYDHTKGILHNDNGQGRDLLWAAAKLYSCGKHINISSYHKHSWYLIKHGELLGYSQAEHLMVAAIARYHRKSLPKKRHDSWQLLIEESQRRIVNDMSLLLRLSCALDRRPEPLVSKLVVESNNKKINIELIPNDLGQNLDLEKWSLNKVILLVKKIKDVEVNIL